MGLGLKLRSSSTYRALRESGILVLPSERTMRDYTHWVQAGAGFMVEVDEQLMEVAKLAAVPEYKKCV